MGAKCTLCKQDMVAADGCTFDTVVDDGGKKWARSTQHFGEPTGRCHDCGAKHGQYHHPGCDAERCPKCGGQMLGCDCWPDELEYEGAPLAPANKKGKV